MTEQELLAKYDVHKSLSDRLLRKNSITLDEVGERLVEFMLDLHTLPDSAREAFCKKYVTHDLAVKEQEFFTLYSRLLTANDRASAAPLKAMTLNGFLLIWDNGGSGSEGVGQTLQLGELMQYNGLFDFLLDLFALNEADQHHVEAMLSDVSQKFCAPVFAMVREMKAAGKLDNLPQFYL